MKFRKSDERYESILDTNSAHVEELPVEEKPQMSGFRGYGASDAGSAAGKEPQ